MRNSGPVLGGVGLRKEESDRKHTNFKSDKKVFVDERRNYIGNGSDYDDDENDEETYGNADESEVNQSDSDIEQNSNLPFFERLAKSSLRNSTFNGDQIQSRQKQLKLKKNRSDKSGEKIGRTNKNAPAVMMSNRPVRRLRIEANNSVKKTVDPRFSDVSGKVNEKIFASNYSFLDKYRADEIQDLSKVLRKVKSAPKRAELKSELIHMKQEATERRRGLKVMERFEAMKAEEREKVKGGKKPFFLKSAAKKVVGLEERYNELKREGKLNKFMTKKRKQNSNKDHRWLPSRRGDDE